MSETDSIKVPPPNRFIAEDCGLTRWRAETDDITVRAVYKGVYLAAHAGKNCVAFTLTVDEARHLAAVLAGAASEAAGPEEGQ